MGRLGLIARGHMTRIVYVSAHSDGVLGGANDSRQVGRIGSDRASETSYLGALLDVIYVLWQLINHFTQGEP